MTDHASIAGFPLDVLRRFRDEIQDFYRDVRDAVIHHGFLIDEGLPESHKVHPDNWWPDLETVFGGLGYELLTTGCAVPIRPTAVRSPWHFYFGKADAADLRRAIEQIEALTEFMLQHWRAQHCHGLRDWAAFLYFLAWETPKPVGYSVESHWFDPTGYRRGDCPFNSLDGFEPWLAGASNVPTGCHFLLLSRDIRACTNEALDVLLTRATQTARQPGENRYTELLRSPPAKTPQRVGERKRTKTSQRGKKKSVRRRRTLSSISNAEKKAYGDNFERDKWLYKNRSSMTAKQLEKELDALSEKNKWTNIGQRAIRHGVKRFALTFNLTQVKGRAGQPRKTRQT